MPGGRRKQYSVSLAGKSSIGASRGPRVFCILHPAGSVCPCQKNTSCIENPYKVCFWKRRCVADAYRAPAYPASLTDCRFASDSEPQRCHAASVVGRCDTDLIRKQKHTNLHAAYVTIARCDVQVSRLRAKPEGLQSLHRSQRGCIDCSRPSKQQSDTTRAGIARQQTVCRGPSPSLSRK